MHFWFLWRLGKPIHPRQDSKEPLVLALRWEPMLAPWEVKVMIGEREWGWVGRRNPQNGGGSKENTAH